MGYYPLTQGRSVWTDGRLPRLATTRYVKGVAMVQQDPVVLADTFMPT